MDKLLIVAHLVAMDSVSCFDYHVTLGAYSLPFFSDLSPSLFQEFGSLDVGRFPIKWNFEPFGFVPPN
jgi:hypothetical protein